MPVVYIGSQGDLEGFWMLGGGRLGSASGGTCVLDVGRDQGRDMH